MTTVLDAYNHFASVWLICTICIGLFGNTMNLIVFGQKQMRKNSTFHFLIFLSLIDILILTICSSNSLLSYGYNIEVKQFSNFTCKLYTFLASYLRHMSSGILIMVNVDRVLVVCGIKSLLNKSFSINLLMIFTAILTAILNSHSLVYFMIEKMPTSMVYSNISKTIQTKNVVKVLDSAIKSNQNDTDVNDLLFSIKYFKITVKVIEEDSNQEDFIENCLPSQKNFYYTFFIVKIWFWLDLIIYSLIPFLVMLTCSIILIKYLRSKNKSLLFLDNKQFRVNRILVLRRIRKNKQLFVMLTIANIFFLSCSLPYCLTNYNFELEEHLNKFIVFVYNILAYSINSFNFLFYGLFSEKYRLVLTSLIRKSKKDQSRNLKLGIKHTENNSSLDITFQTNTSNKNCNVILNNPINFDQLIQITSL